MSERFEARSIRETCALLGTDPERGLSEKEAALRHEANGPNELKEAKKKSAPEVFLEQLNDPLIYVLMAAAVISLLLHEISDAAIIAVVVCMNAAVGMIQEGKAQRALDSLKKLTSPRAYCIRDGKEREIAASQLVPGDIVCLEAGCQIPADLRLTRCGGLKVEESALTGESLPIEKNADFLAAGQETALGDRRNMAYMSTIVTSGRGEGVVTAIGMNTQIGRIAAMIDESPQEMTPLQKRLGELGTLLSILSLFLCGALFLIALIQKRDVAEMLITAISLAVAAVPEGLPAVVTICLALSVTKMVRVHTIVRKLPAVETLGAVSVVCSDKTGTLTQNRMTVEKCFLNQKLVDAKALTGDRRREAGRLTAASVGQTADRRLAAASAAQAAAAVRVPASFAGPAASAVGAGLEEFLRGMTLCNDGVLEGEERFGDPTELALLDLAAAYGVRRQTLEKTLPRTAELPFDSSRKMMSTFHRSGAESVTYTKGAPDEVLKKCSRILMYGKEAPLQELQRRQILSAVESMSGQALRTLAVALRRGGKEPKEEDLTFIGMVGMKDPPRPEAAGAVERFRRAGVSTVMITGDHVDTAFAIASQLGIVKRREQCMSETQLKRLPDKEFLRALDDVRVFARVSPQSKVRIVKGFKQKGKIVAMTGDGVNDAPSLKAADIGIAMGQNGTDVAKQASEIILTDDNFATIEKAIEEGRGVYENIKKSVIFLLSSNLGEIMTMFTAVLMGLASPLKSSHILWINLITDSLPALALGADDNDADSLMEKPPRDPKESLFADGGFLRTCFYGMLIAGISLAAFFTIPYGIMRERGIAFSPSAFAVILQNEAVLGRAQTYAFTVLGMSQLFHAIGMRDVERSVFRMNHLQNRLMLLALAAGFVLQIAVTEIPFLTAAFGTAHLSLREWLRLLILAAFPLLAHELLVLLGGKGKGRKGESGR
ncbi:MAG TPA: cation-translocating P-type ATPase [Candidatus Eisenbergiella merdavium]|uniref:P-type Ca(2+) transporter n=1 Tax=Candidatus Eisenbergiella merdavium TaxID=2838551 RepID=A0A9D2SRH4_9FIRM|nr:cation-translocating P-type ATPase [Candidatus Eisenbergiella merdavium]